MAQYIPKAALVAGIKKRKAICEKVTLDLRTKDNKAYYHGKAQAYGEVLDYLDTIEVKEVDLEKELTIYFGDNWKQDTPIEVQNDMISYAKHFFELGLKAQKGEEV